MLLLYSLQEEIYFPIREINMFCQKNLSNGIDLEFLSFKLPIPTVSLHLGPYLKGECMNQKAKPHKHSLVVEDQNDIRVLGLCGLVWEEFEYNE